MALAPIALFLFNRPDHTEITLGNLAGNELARESELIVFIDGPRNAEDEKKQIQLVELLEKYRPSFQNVTINRSQVNSGLAKSLSGGITKVLEKYSQVIVLEDDLATSKIFLRYMNKCLNLYAGSPHVYSVNGYMFPLNLTENSIFLSPLATSSWGWATWADKWKTFSMDMEYRTTIQENEFLRKRFNVGNLDYVSYMNNPNSWAIRWYYSVFIRNGLGVFPTRSLVKNIGLDGSGTNCFNEFTQRDVNQTLPELSYLDKIDMRREALLQNYFKSSSRKGLIGDLKTKAKIIAKKILTP